ncbi:MAG: TonB family protein [Propionivibrio sp.]
MTAAVALDFPHRPLRAERALWWALGVSIALHALLLSLHFKFPEASRIVQDKALEIILVNSRSAHRPKDAQALAQANLDGGGDTDQNRRAKTPLPPSSRQQAGNDLEHAQKRVQALEAQQQKLLGERSRLKQAERKDTQAQPEPTPTLSGRDLAHSALAMARLEAEISRSTEEYNKRPRKKFIGTRTAEYRYARYMEDWRLKVERVGTLNYPQAARGRLYGTLQLSVWIRTDGSVDKIEIERSSGQRVLDDAARRIVHMASPYAPFPPDIQRDTDVLVITRNWTFTRGDQLETH